MNDVEPYSGTQADYRALSEGFAAAVRGQDADILRSFTTDTVTWSLPGASIIAGVAHGVAGILRRGKLLADYGVTSVSPISSMVTLALASCSTIPDRVSDELSMSI